MKFYFLEKPNMISIKEKLREEMKGIIGLAAMALFVVGTAGLNALNFCDTSVSYLDVSPKNIFQLSHFVDTLESDSTLDPIPSPCLATFFTKNSFVKTYAGTLIENSGLSFRSQLTLSGITLEKNHEKGTIAIRKNIANNWKLFIQASKESLVRSNRYNAQGGIEISY
jgi:hypothetical protein